MNRSSLSRAFNTMPVTHVYPGPRAFELGRDALNAIGALCSIKEKFYSLSPSAPDGLCERSHSAKEMETDRF